jgi:hypothetical protein
LNSKEVKFSLFGGLLSHTATITKIRLPGAPKLGT